MCPIVDRDKKEEIDADPCPSHDRILAQHLCPQILIMDTNFQQVISANVRGHYRQHPLALKRALAALLLEPGASVARFAREHGDNANQVFSWRRLYQQGRLGTPVLMRDDVLLPVVPGANRVCAEQRRFPRKSFQE